MVRCRRANGSGPRPGAQALLGFFYRQPSPVDRTPGWQPRAMTGRFFTGSADVSARHLSGSSISGRLSASAGLPGTSHCPSPMMNPGGRRGLQTSRTAKCGLSTSRRVHESVNSGWENSERPDLNVTVQSTADNAKKAQFRFFQPCAAGLGRHMDFACCRSSNFWILPVDVLGSS